MRIKPDPNIARLERQVDPGAALVAGLHRERRSTWRSLAITSAVSLAIVGVFLSGRMPDAGGFFVIAGVICLVIIGGQIRQLRLMTGRWIETWRLTKVETRYVWKVTDVRDGDGDVTEYRMFLLPHAPGPGERVADPHALGKLKYISGPDVLRLELIRFGSTVECGHYVGREIWLATSADGERKLIMLVPDGSVLWLSSWPEPATPEAIGRR